MTDEMSGETRLAVIAIIIEGPEAGKAVVQTVNDLLHDYSKYIRGRMGLPYPAKQVNIISVVMDAPQDQISALSGKLGRLSGVNSRVLYARSGGQTI